MKGEEGTGVERVNVVFLYSGVSTRFCRSGILEIPIKSILTLHVTSRPV